MTLTLVCAWILSCAPSRTLSLPMQNLNPPHHPGRGVDLPCPASKDYFITFFFFCNKLLKGLLTSLNFYSLFFHRATSDLNPKSDHIKSLIKTFQEVPTLLRIKAQILAIAYMDLRHRFPRTILLCVQFLSLVPSISLWLDWTPYHPLNMTRIFELVIELDA